MAEKGDQRRLLAKLEPYGQQHLLQFWEELSRAEQIRLAGQIEALDLEQIAALFRGECDQPDWAELSRGAGPPPAIRLADRRSGTGGSPGISRRAAHDRGEHALRTGNIAVLLTAGGQGSRLGFDLPKALFPIGPISGASLLQIHIEKVRALGNRYGNSVPLYLMTSPATHEETVRYLASSDNFGLAEEDLFVFCQGTMPAVDARSGKLLLAQKHELWLSPDGHGGTVAALRACGALEHIRKRGVGHLFYLQVDNPLAPICDCELLGFHLLAESQLTSIAVAKGQPHDKLGNFVTVDGALYVIEYSDFPDDVAQLRDDSGALRFWAGSIAVHVFDLSLLERAADATDGLPFHSARKKVPAINQARHSPPPGERARGDRAGELYPLEQTDALKFERFIFDLLPIAERPMVVEFPEEECFAPLKNAPGATKDTAAYVQELMFAQYGRWLEAAGARVAAGVNVELSPLYALDAAGVAERVSASQSFSKSQYLRD